MLPWQMKSTFIKSLSPFKMRCPASICSDLRGVNSSLCIGHFCTQNANLSKILQDVYSNRSRNGVELLNNYYSSSIISSTLSEPQTGHFSFSTSLSVTDTRFSFIANSHSLEINSA